MAARHQQVARHRAPRRSRWRWRSGRRLGGWPSAHPGPAGRSGATVQQTLTRRDDIRRLMGPLPPSASLNMPAAAGSSSALAQLAARRGLSAHLRGDLCHGGDRLGGRCPPIWSTTRASRSATTSSPSGRARCWRWAARRPPRSTSRASSRPSRSPCRPTRQAFLWHYPPTFHLVVLPLALLPYLAAYAAWVASTFAAFAWVVRRFAPRPETLWLLLAFPGHLHQRLSRPERIPDRRAVRRRAAAAEGSGLSLPACCSA